MGVQNEPGYVTNVLRTSVYINFFNVLTYTHMYIYIIIISNDERYMCHLWLTIKK